MSLPHDLTHPFTHVVYEIDNHTHIFAGGGFETIEDMAEGLAEAVYECARSREHRDHTGQAHCIQPHDAEEAEKAYKSAIDQLITRDYWAEYLDIQRRIEHYEMWNYGNPHPRPVPAIVCQPNPNNNNTWQAFVTHPETGIPTPYDIPESLLELPRPEPKHYKKGKLGYYYKGNIDRSLVPARGLNRG